MKTIFVPCWMISCVFIFVIAFFLSAIGIFSMGDKQINICVNQALSFIHTHTQHTHTSCVFHFLLHTCFHTLNMQTDLNDFMRRINIHLIESKKSVFQSRFTYLTFIHHVFFLFSLWILTMIWLFVSEFHTLMLFSSSIFNGACLLYCNCNPCIYFPYYFGKNEKKIVYTKNNFLEPVFYSHS